MWRDEIFLLLLIFFILMHSFYDNSNYNIKLDVMWPIVGILIIF